MRSLKLLLLSVSASVMAIALVPAVLWAQSGSRTRPPARSGYSTPSTVPARASADPVALEGFCPVSIVEMHKWVRGNPAYQLAFDGHTYLFADAHGKQMFQANPLKYVPALGGDCVVALKTMGKRVPGNIRAAAFHGKRLFLFANEKAKQMFLREPAAYENVDLAYGGRCVVCQQNMGRAMPGKPELTTLYHGMRYQFASVDQQREFMRNPSKYAVRTTAASASGAGSTTRPPAVGSGTGSGRR